MVSPGQDHRKPSRFRSILKGLMVLGFVLMPIGPCARIRNEGMFPDDPVGPPEVSRRWQIISYVLIPCGAAITIGAGIALVIVDRRRN